MLELFLTIIGTIIGLMSLGLIINHRIGIYGQQWRDSIQFKLVIVFFVLMFIIPYLFIFIMPVDTVSDNGLDLFSSFFLSFFAIYIGILSIAISIIWGSLYADSSKKGSSLKKPEIEKQGIVLLFLIGYSSYVVIVSVFLPIFNRILTM